MKIQGRETHALFFQESLRAVVSKLQNWRRKANIGIIAKYLKKTLWSDADKPQIQPD